MISGKLILIVPLIFTGLFFAPHSDLIGISDAQSVEAIEIASSLHYLSENEDSSHGPIEQSSNYPLYRHSSNFENIRFGDNSLDSPLSEDFSSSLTHLTDELELVESSFKASGDEEFDLLVNKYNLQGAGTDSDPYIIDDLNISSSYNEIYFENLTYSLTFINNRFSFYNSNIWDGNNSKNTFHILFRNNTGNLNITGNTLINIAPRGAVGNLSIEFSSILFLNISGKINFDSNLLNYENFYPGKLNGLTFAKITSEIFIQDNYLNMSINHNKYTEYNNGDYYGSDGGVIGISIRSIEASVIAKNNSILTSYSANVNAYIYYFWGFLINDIDGITQLENNFYHLNLTTDINSNITGLSLSDTSGNVNLLDNHFNYNIFDGVYYGITVKSLSADLNISNNSLSRSSSKYSINGFGIVARDIRGSVSIRENSIVEFAQRGISVNNFDSEKHDSLDISRNIIEDSTYFDHLVMPGNRDRGKGILVHSSGIVKITDNVITKTEGVGIYIFSGEDVLISGNVIHSGSNSYYLSDIGISVTTHRSDLKNESYKVKIIDNEIFAPQGIFYSDFNNILHLEGNEIHASVGLSIYPIGPGWNIVKNLIYFKWVGIDFFMDRFIVDYYEFINRRNRSLVISNNIITYNNGHDFGSTRCIKVDIRIDMNLTSFIANNDFSDAFTGVWLSSNSSSFELNSNRYTSISKNLVYIGKYAQVDSSISETFSYSEAGYQNSYLKFENGSLSSFELEFVSFSLDYLYDYKLLLGQEIILSQNKISKGLKIKIPLVNEQGIYNYTLNYYNSESSQLLFSNNINIWKIVTIEPYIAQARLDFNYSSSLVVISIAIFIAIIKIKIKFDKKSRINSR